VPALGLPPSLLLPDVSNSRNGTVRIDYQTNITSNSSASILAKQFPSLVPIIRSTLNCLCGFRLLP
jgi:hypothetical protein